MHREAIAVSDHNHEVIYGLDIGGSSQSAHPASPVYFGQKAVMLDTAR
jgi:hypothetical protein